MIIGKALEGKKLGDVKTNEEFFWFWLSKIDGVGAVAVKELLDVMKTPENIYNATRKELNDCISKSVTASKIDSIISYQGKQSIVDEYNDMKRMGISMTHMGEEKFPQSLQIFKDSPFILYYKGSLPDENLPAVSIVGARNCTEYGKTVAYEFGKKFSSMGIQVISGMALGIDAAGNRGALDDLTTPTYAILGCGVDICYPRSNIGVYDEIIKSGGGVISEYPPGTAPNASHFPMRNRIISAMSDAILVVEARKKSGSLITANLAADYNKDVFVIPGRLGDKLSEGCISLWKDGALPLFEPEDILASSEVKSKFQNKKIGQIHMNLQDKSIKSGDDIVASEKELLYSELNLYPMGIDSLMEKTGLSLSCISDVLFELEMEGLVKQVSTNCFVRMHL